MDSSEYIKSLDEYTDLVDLNMSLRMLMQIVENQPQLMNINLWNNKKKDSLTEENYFSFIWRLICREKKMPTFNNLPKMQIGC